MQQRRTNRRTMLKATGAAIAAMAGGKTVEATSSANPKETANLCGGFKPGGCFNVPIIQGSVSVSVSVLDDIVAAFDQPVPLSFGHDVRGQVVAVRREGETLLADFNDLGTGFFEVTRRLVYPCVELYYQPTKLRRVVLQSPDCPTKQDIIWLSRWQEFTWDGQRRDGNHTSEFTDEERQQSRDAADAECKRVRADTDARKAK